MPSLNYSCKPIKPGVHRGEGDSLFKKGKRFAGAAATAAADAAAVLPVSARPSAITRGALPGQRPGEIRTKHLRQINRSFPRGTSIPARAKCQRQKKSARNSPCARCGGGAAIAGRIGHPTILSKRIFALDAPRKGSGYNLSPRLGVACNELSDGAGARS